jgi:integral membrane protein (TIGR01906 family)
MNHWLKLFLQIIVVVATPVVLVVLPIRVLMHPRWVYFEYNRPGFPPDDFGLGWPARTQLAITGIDSIIGPRGVVVLQEARLPDGSPAFNEREISHMQDVRTVTANLYVVQVVLFAAAVIALAALARGEPRAASSALLRGSVLTIALLVVLVILVLTGFDTFFTTFHRIFFRGDTWLFSYTDTLIRLYPVQFWFDAATAIGVMSIAEAIVLGVLAWRWGRAAR